MIKDAESGDEIKLTKDFWTSNGGRVHFGQLITNASILIYHS